MTGDFEALDSRLGAVAQQVVKLYQCAARTGFDSERMAQASSVLYGMVKKCLVDEPVTEEFIEEVLAQFEIAYPLMLAALDAGERVS
jgi:hypothetical protein